jgi:hypothetical protein
MPTVPSPTAALIYAAVKLGGYAIFAHGLNRIGRWTVSPIRFSAAKTGLGLVVGLAYVFALAPALGVSESSDAELFLGAAPVRMAVWLLVLGMFYGFRENPKLMGAAVFVGVAWSYILDGLMWLIYKVLPGMVMPFC